MKYQVRRRVTARWVRPRPTAGPGQTVYIELIDQVGGVSQSFLITSGDMLRLNLNGFIQDGDGIRVHTVPVTIRARTA